MLRGVDRSDRPEHPLLGDPCYWCGGPVLLSSGECEHCGGIHRDPQPGPQDDFVSSEAYITLYGGARGGGKSWALELIALLYCHIPGWTGLILRAELADITKAGGLWDKAKRCFAGSDATFRQTPHHHVAWPSGAKLEFGYLGDRNIRAYQGQEYAYIGVDEATHFDVDDLMFLALCNRTTCGAPAIMRWTCNPDPDHALREFVDPWVLPDGTADRSKSGHLRFFAMLDGERVWGDSRAEVSEATGRPGDQVYEFSYVPALVEDNRILLEQDPTYVGKLSLRGTVIERQHRFGDWNAKANLRGLLRGLLDNIVTEPLAPIVARARGWDMAGTAPHEGNKAPDFTAGPLVLQDAKGNRYFAGLAITRDEPTEVLALMRSTATLDGPLVSHAVYKDPAQAGKGYAIFVEAHLRKSSRCGPVMMLPTGSKQDQKILNATPVAEDIAQGRMYLLAGPWLEAEYKDGGSAPRTILGLIRWMLGSFPSDKSTDKDDIIDGLAAARVALEQVHIVVGSPRETARKAADIARSRLPGGGRRGYGGRR